MPHLTEATSWQPQIAKPNIALYRFKDLGTPSGNGEALSRWLVRNAVQITFPSTDPSTRVNDSERGFRTWEMRYTGPSFFDFPDIPAEVAALRTAYNNRMPEIWLKAIGLKVQPRAGTERAAEAFITDPQKGESADPHSDTLPTCAGYPLPGGGLIISHCLNARNIKDIEVQPATLVLPREETFLFFLGTSHPHVGINLCITSADNRETRKAKFEAVCRRFKIVDRVQNLYERDRFGPGSPDERGPAAIPNLLCSDFGDRVVLSLNFDDGLNAGSSLDKILV